MTTFSLVTLPIVVILVVVRYHKDICNWLSTTVKNKGFTKNGAAHPPSDVKRMAPYPAQPIKGRERYRVLMDIRKLDVQNWLTLDKNYMEEHAVRDDLLREKRDQVLQCLPESAQACQEALEEVSEFLCERYPNMFNKVVEGDRTSIQNCMTGERFDIGGASYGGEGIDALEAAVRLTMEDLSILMINEEGEYYLYGTYFIYFFPFQFFWSVLISIADPFSQRRQRKPFPDGMDSPGAYRMDNLPFARTGPSVASAHFEFRDQVSGP